ncbi:MAG: peptidylprolyl isomerase, partial [Bacteroidota bacterium]
TGVKKGEMFMSDQTALDSGEFQGNFDEYLVQNQFKDFTYRSDQVADYLKEGGAPWLDFQYTIFGEVVYGMEIISKIEVTPSGTYDRPKKAIRIIQMKFPEANAE